MKYLNWERYNRDVATAHYFQPGLHLDDTELVSMYRQLLDIVARRGTALEHRLLDPDADVAAIRRLYTDTIVNISYYDDEATGFLISPILREKNFTIVHTGLTVIAANHGFDIMGLLGLGLCKITSQHLGAVYSTNISSTPGILEAFAKLTSQVWPDPDAALVRPPRHYRQVARTLVRDYVRQVFPDPDAVTFDERRFVMRSHSTDMGFNTNFRELTRAQNFKYLNFCFAWLDYDKEEDLIQVARFTRMGAVRTRLLMAYLKVGVFPFIKTRGKRAKQRTRLALKHR